MPTIQQLIRKPRNLGRKTKSMHMQACPQKRGFVQSLYYHSKETS